MPRVLVVDDEADVRMLLEEVIQRANHGLNVVAIATGGGEAIEQWRETRPDVIVLDQRMPGMSGIEAAEAILAEAPTQCILLFSAYLDDDVIRRASQLGVRACLRKNIVSVPEDIWKYAAT